MNLNDRISKVIEFSKLSSSEFADAIDVQRSSITHITSGRNKPSLDFLIKVKNHFPELQWDWLIKGDGEMWKSVLSEEKIKTTSPLDLFALVNDENFGITEREDKLQKDNLQNETARESAAPPTNETPEKISDSRRLEVPEKNDIVQTPENQQNKIKRIVLFFENGKFESFEP
ncbi:MAG: helix-turn-helix domain-containing protein [Flavobacteriaceae bacterium]|jgi:DNA-binding XRE family transcriptional regulator|nr:helix-turn-helix domain-containing protein [Flavobacteriaceae bacterium]